MKLIESPMGIGSHGIFFFQAEDGIRDQPRSRGLGDVYKRQWETLSISSFYLDKSKLK